MKAAIIIANYNKRELLKKCLISLKNQTFQDFEVFVVDNGSRDSSVSYVKKKFPKVNLKALSKNTGFAKANNIGIKKALEKDQFKNQLKYILPLNNDIELDPRYLEEMIKAAESYKAKNVKLGVLAAKLYFWENPRLLNTTGTVIQRDGSGMERGFKNLDKGQFDKKSDTFGSCAAAALYTKKMLLDTKFKDPKGFDNFFDNDFFAYYEDLDLNYRSRLKGYEAFFVPKAIGYHLHSATGVSFSPFKSFHVHRNQYYVLIKNFPLPFLLLGFAIMPFRYLFLLISAIIGRGPSAQLKKSAKTAGLFKIVIFSWFEIIKNFRLLLKKRRLIQKDRKVSLRIFNSWFKNYKASWKKMIFD
ncbi:MAG: glycosyltransferase [Candidatus Moranbacteria bacterium]|nr:glycosyltransferase [Candidatus Moranbacteria bacterium]